MDTRLIIPRAPNDTSPSLLPPLIRSILKNAIIKLRRRPVKLFNRYQSAGGKWHHLPMIARHNRRMDRRAEMIGFFAFFVQDDGTLSQHIAERFENLQDAFVFAGEISHEEDADLSELVSTMLRLLQMLKRAEQAVYAIESAVEEAVALADSLYEQGLIPHSDPLEGKRLEVWDSWLGAVYGWIEEQKK